MSKDCSGRMCRYMRNVRGFNVLRANRPASIGKGAPLALMEPYTYLNIRPKAPPVCVFVGPKKLPAAMARRSHVHGGV